jgi:LysR family cys regulon transcriptional activator
VNFQQLRIVREAVRQNYNLTEVANALFTSQSGVSRHIKDLEDELGIELFVRRGKRLLGLTEPGQELVGIVERMLLDARNIKQLAQQFSQRDEGKLVIATTHTQARYVLPPVVTTFKQQFPKVHLELQQASPREIIALLQSGDADIGIATEALDVANDLVSFPYHRWHHAVIVPQGHALEAVRPLTLEAVAEYPVITYNAGYTGRTRIDDTFAKLGLAPDIVLSALDSDVIKTYVELGLGIGIVASVALNAERDQGLALLESRGLFPENTTYLAIRHGHYLRSYAYRFIEACSPALDEAQVRAAIHPTRDSED